MEKPVAIRSIRYRHLFFVRQCSELPIARIETRVNDGLGKISIFTAFKLRQINSFHFGWGAMEYLLIEAVAYSRLPIRVQIGAIFRLDFACEINKHPIGI